MSVERRFRLLEAVPGAGQSSDRELAAREITSGTLVVVHLLGGGSTAETEGFLGRVRGLPEVHRGYVLDVGEMSGQPCVVTQVLPFGLTLRNWIEVVAPAVRKVPEAPKKAEAGEFTTLFQAADEPMVALPPQPKISAGPAPEIPPDLQSEPGEFTRLFRAGGEPQPGFDVHATQAMPHVVAGPAPKVPPDPRSEPGEFTRLFQAIGEPQPKFDLQSTQAMPHAVAGVPPQPNISAGPASDISPGPRSEPGEFTRLVQAVSEPQPRLDLQSTQAMPHAVAAVPPQPKTPSGPAPEVSPDPRSEPGEFTRLFRAEPQPRFDLQSTQAMPHAVAGVPPQPPISAGPAPDIPPGARSEPGEFTRLFRTSPEPAPPPQGPPAGQRWVEFTQTFQPPETPRSSQRPAGLAAETPAAPPRSSGQAIPPTAGEFTRLFQTPASGPPKPAPGSAPPRMPSPMTPNAPGEFTRMFESPAAGSPVPSAPASRQQSDFTRMMETPFASPGSNRPAPQPFQARPAQPPGEYTAMFGPASAADPGKATGVFKVPSPPPAAQTPAAPAGPGEFTRMFDAPTPKSPGPGSPSAPSAPSGSAGDFTKMFASPAPPAAVVPPAPKPALQPPAIAPKAATSYMPLIVGLAVLLVIAVVVVLVFTMAGGK